MKKLTKGTPKTSTEAQRPLKPVEKVAGTADAKCCAKTSKNRVGCHD